MAEVRWSRHALRDLEAIGAYFERSSPAYARSLVTRLYRVGEMLSEFPRLGREVPELEVDHIRGVIREGYRLVYVAADDQVEILTVLHGRQDLAKKLRRE